MGAKVTSYPLNPNCSNLLVGKGNEKFVYFYYSIGNKRKQIKFKEGLNDSGITESVRNKRIKSKYNEIHNNLSNMVFNGKTFETEKPIATVQPFPLIEIAITTYLDSRRPYVVKKTIDNYEGGLNFFLQYLKHTNQNKLTIDQIDSLLIEDYIAYMLVFISPLTKKNLKVNTIKEYKDRLAFVLNFWRKKKRLLQYNPMEEVNTGNVLNKIDSISHKAMTVEELKQMIAYFKKHRKPPYLTFVLLIYYTHLRPKEICRLQLKDFDMNKRVINLIASKSKTRVERTVPLDLPIYNHLLSTGVDFSHPDHQHSYFISYSNRNRIDYIGSRMYNHNNISYSFNTMMLDLGLQDRGFTKYGLKHTANVHEVIYEGMSFAEVQLKNGHTMERQTQTYLRNLKEFMTGASYKERVLQFDI